MSDPVIRKMCSLTSDREALSYLTDIELIQDPKDPRPYELIWVSHAVLIPATPSHPVNAVDMDGAIAYNTLLTSRPRECADEFQHFKENPYFSNSTLTKKYQLPKDKHPAPSDGSITDEMRAFDSDVDLDVPVSEIIPNLDNAENRVGGAH